MFIDTLDRITNINLATGGYSYNTIMVLRDPELGDFWWAADSGCSCPRPFENIGGFGDMNVLNEHTWRDFNNTVMDRDRECGIGAVDRLSWLRTLSTTISKLRSEPFVPVVPNPFQQEEA